MTKKPKSGTKLKSRKKRIVKIIKKSPIIAAPMLSSVEMLCLEYKFKNNL